MEDDPFCSYDYSKTIAKQIQTWLDNFQSCDNNFGACILIGNIGIGKTSLIKSLMKNEVYDPLFLTPALMPAKTHMKSFVHDNMLSLQMEHVLQGIKKQRIIIIDDVDNLSYKQKSCLLYFLSWIYPSKRKNRRCLAIENNVPFIFVGRHTHVKALQTVLKHCLQLTLQPPPVKEQFAMVKQFCRAYNVVTFKTAINALIGFCNNDLRCLKLMCKEVVQISQKRITESVMQRFLHHYGKVSPQVGVSWSTLDVINGDVCFEHAYSIYQQDKYLLPLMIHENYPLLYRYDTYQDNDSIRSLVDMLITFDQYDTHMYRHQFWSLQELCGILVCGGVSSIIRAARDHASDHTNTCFDVSDIRFTRHLNRTSLITVRKRKLSNLMEKTEIYDIDGLYYLRNMLFAHKKIDKTIQKRFNLTDQECSHLLKIDSLSQTITKC